MLPCTSCPWLSIAAGPMVLGHTACPDFPLSHTPPMVGISRRDMGSACSLTQLLQNTLHWVISYPSLYWEESKSWMQVWDAWLLFLNFPRKHNDLIAPVCYQNKLLHLGFRRATFLSCLLIEIILVLFLLVFCGLFTLLTHVMGLGGLSLCKYVELSMCF